MRSGFLVFITVTEDWESKGRVLCGKEAAKKGWPEMSSVILDMSGFSWLQPQVTKVTFY